MSKSPAIDNGPPNWLHNRVLDGVQFLRALGLPGTPAAEVATLTFIAWVSAIWNHGSRSWVEELDSARLYRAFESAAANAERWPTPKEVLQAMQPRQSMPAIGHTLKAPSPEQAELLRNLRRRFGDAPATAVVKAALATNATGAAELSSKKPDESKS
jgi:hypothetical protein